MVRNPYRPRWLPLWRGGFWDTKRVAVEQLLWWIGQGPTLRIRWAARYACRRLRAERDDALAHEARLRKAYHLAVQAAKIASDGGGHSHWDPTMRHGAGCDLCARQSAARAERDRLLGEAIAALEDG